jgi:glycosyltransferase involved in cell wall biosynthesis
MPTVSVIIPSYNHEKFIRECVQSVLDQTYQDFEIIITDDGSTDHTVDIIESFSDPRIKLFKHPKNKGVCVAANNCLQNASGNYVAWLSSDDAWYPEKLAVQVDYLDEHTEIGVVFGKVVWVDEYGNPIDKFPYLNVYDVENRTRYEWLREFFMIGNCLSLPCSLVRRECFSETGMFDPVLAGVPDLDLWVRICLNYDIQILDQKLIRNRWISDESNASGSTTKNIIRNRFEFRHILNHYLKIEKPEELLLIFPEAVHYGKVTLETIPYFLGRIAISSGLDYQMLWGLDIIYELLQDEKMVRFLEDQYDFIYTDFIKLVRECDPFRFVERQLHIEQLQLLKEQVTEKDRAIHSLTEHVSEKERAIQSLIEQVTDIKNGLAYRMTIKYRHYIDLLLPIGTKRRGLYTLIIQTVSGNRSKM